MNQSRGPSGPLWLATTSTPSRALGLEGLQNGALMARAAEAGYDALITVDKGFEHELNLSNLPLSVALLRARSNRLEDLEPLVPELLDQLGEAAPGSFIKVGA